MGALTSKTSAFKYRQWEFDVKHSIDLHDSFGANILAYTRGTELLRILPRINSTLNDEFITDRVRFSYDALKYQRLDHPYLLKQDLKSQKKQLIPVTYNTAFVKLLMKTVHANKIHTIIGPFCDLMQLKLLDHNLQILNKRNSLIYNESAQHVINNDNLNHYLYNGSIDDIRNYETIFLIGCDLRLTFPLLFFKVQQGLKETTIQRVVSIGSWNSSIAGVINIGNNLDILFSVINGKHKLCKTLYKSKRILLFLGNSLLRTKLNIPELRDKLSLFCKCRIDTITSFANSSSINANYLMLLKPQSLISNYNSIIQNEKNRDNDLLVLLNADDLQYKSNNSLFTIYFGAHADLLATTADLIFPIKNHFEKSGVYFNLQGVLQSAPKVIDPSYFIYTFSNVFHSLLLQYIILTRMKAKSLLEMKKINIHKELPRNIIDIILKKNINNNMYTHRSFLLYYNLYFAAHIVKLHIAPYIVQTLFPISFLTQFLPLDIRLSSNVDDINADLYHYTTIILFNTVTNKYSTEMRVNNIPLQTETYNTYQNNSFLRNSKYMALASYRFINKQNTFLL